MSTQLIRHFHEMVKDYLLNGESGPFLETFDEVFGNAAEASGISQIRRDYCGETQVNDQTIKKVFRHENSIEE